MKMMTFSRFSYKRLKHEETQADVNELQEAIRQLELPQQSSGNYFFSNTATPTKKQQLPPPPSRRSSGRRRRWKLTVSGLRRFFTPSSTSYRSMRRRRRRRSSVKMIWAKVVQRLKESREHFGDLFAGDYLFLQVAPEYSFNNNISSKNYQYPCQNFTLPPTKTPIPPNLLTYSKS